jgi:hypothetical protein
MTRGRAGWVRGVWLFCHSRQILQGCNLNDGFVGVPLGSERS